jgi:hypothetical protein
MRGAHGGLHYCMTTMLRCGILSLGQQRQEFEMFESVKSFVRSFRIPSVEELELAYLNASISRVDLENRQRQIQGGLFRQRHIL